MADAERVESAVVIHSPDDLEAKAAKKRSTFWVGYTVHFTETGEPDQPLLMTQVTTTPGPTPDRAALPEIHAT